MKQAISLDRWEQAQTGEKRFHIAEPVETSYENYKLAYSYYFKYLGIDKDLKGKSIIEIGPGRISSLLFCENRGKSYIIEPTVYEGIDHLYQDPELILVRERAEDFHFPLVDEVWMFNLLQHVQDPDFLISKCKKNSKIIRFFEPVDLPTDNEHPFSFSRDDFYSYFGDCIKDYVSIGEPNFHGARCVYGVYESI